MPSQGVRTAPALVLAGALVGLVACGSEPAVELPRWTLSIEGRADRPVELPAHLDDDLGARPGRYRLTTRVELPAALAGQPLTFAIASLPALATLTADGEPCPELDPASHARYRGTGPLAFRVSAAATARGALDLELTVEHTWIQSGWIDAVPRLSATPAGDARFLFVKYAARASHIAALGAFLGVALTSLIMSRDPKNRRAHAFHVACCLVGTAYPAFFLGLLSDLVGTWDCVVICVTVPLSCLLGLETFSAYFGSGRVHRGFYVALAINSLLAVWLGQPFGLNRYQTPITAALTIAIVAAIVSRLRVARRQSPRPPNVDIFLISWLSPMAFSAIDLVAFNAWWLPVPGWMDGLRLSSFGLVSYAIWPSVALARDQLLSLQRADRLNAELATLNDALRRQIAERSRDLGDALRQLADAPAGELAIGEVVDERYRVVRPLGRGGMAQVYEVERLSDQRRLALKILIARSSHTDLARFAREAQLTTRVAHPNLVAVLDVGVVPGRLIFIVMELIAGGSLEDHRPRFGGPAWARGVLSQIADGLAAIHAAGIVHRDLKPANILALPAEPAAVPVVKIADFGIATVRAVGGAAATTISGLEATLIGSDDAALAKLTATGTTVGTPMYMAPEMAVPGSEPGEASDAYSFGLLAFELLTARYPFPVPPVLTVLRGGAPPVPPQLPRIAGLGPEALEVLDRCLAAAPGDRPSAVELARALASA